MTEEPRYTSLITAGVHVGGPRSRAIAAGAVPVWSAAWSGVRTAFSGRPTFGLDAAFGSDRLNPTQPTELPLCPFTTP